MRGEAEKRLFLIVFENFLAFFGKFFELKNLFSVTQVQKSCIGGFRCGWSVLVIFQFATVLSPIHDKTNIFKNLQFFLLALRHVYV
jgi:hypothetical protein